MNKVFKLKQKVTWHNNSECGKVIDISANSVTIKWEGAGILSYPKIVANSWIK